MQETLSEAVPAAFHHRVELGGAGLFRADAARLLSRLPCFDGPSEDVVSSLQRHPGDLGSRGQRDLDVLELRLQ